MTLEYAIAEINILRKRVEAVLNGVAGNADTHAETLIDIATYFLNDMGEMIQIIQLDIIGSR